VVNRGSYSLLQLSKTFVPFIENADLTAEETNRFVMQKFVDYVTEFCSRKRWGRIEYMKELYRECKKRNFLDSRCSKLVRSALDKVSESVEDGYLDVDLAAEILRKEVLDSPEIWRYTPQNRY
jgi:hypothetical protein